MNAGKTRFACVDGPEFDAHQVDFDTLILRNRAWFEEEKLALEQFREPAGREIRGIGLSFSPRSSAPSAVKDFVTSFVIGRTETVDELMDEEGYDAVFLATGAGLPYFLNLPGENLAGIYSANEFLTRVNLMNAYKFPEYDTPVRVGKRVAVLGAGNTAMDAARVALRLGPEKVYMVYHRSRAEVPARGEEAEHAREEGIEFMFLTNPTQFFGNTSGWVTGMEVMDMELGEPDDSGRRRPVPVKGSQHSFDVDTVIVAVGQGPNPLVQSTTPGAQYDQVGQHHHG